MDEKNRRDGANGRIDLGDMTFGEFATLQERERGEQQAQANARFGDAVVARLGLPEPGGRNPNPVQAQASRQPARPQSVEREMKDRRAELENRPLGEAAFERAQGMHASRFGRELPDNRQSQFQAFEAAQGHHAFGLPRKQGPGAVMNYLAFQRNGGWTANASRLTKDLRELYESVETRLREFENVEIDLYEQ